EDLSFRKPVGLCLGSAPHIDLKLFTGESLRLPKCERFCDRVTRLRSSDGWCWAVREEWGRCSWISLSRRATTRITTRSSGSMRHPRPRSRTVSGLWLRPSSMYRTSKCCQMSRDSSRHGDGCPT
ncbi:hypothetical protein LTR47_011770, partial [Exophiala xenobiotica]